MDDVLTIIKRRASVRKYKKKKIPKKIIDKIIEAGIWGPSVPSFLGIQCWKFLVVTGDEEIVGLAAILKKFSQRERIGVNILINASSKILAQSPVVVVVYKTKEFEVVQKKYKRLYLRFRSLIKKAQYASISAAVQNMILCADSLGVGSCWLDTPLLCSDAINKFFKSKNELFAILTFGYPDQKGRRSARKPLDEMLEYVK